MMQFDIHIHEDNEFSVAMPIFGGYDRLVCAGMCWNEMLGLVARLCLTKINFPEQRFASDRPIKQTLTVTELQERHQYGACRGGCFYTIESDDGRFIDHLTFDEMLGFIAQYTLTGKQMFGGLRTYAEWADQPFSRRTTEQPVALLCLERA